MMLFYTILIIFILTHYILNEGFKEGKLTILIILLVTGGVLSFFFKDLRMIIFIAIILLRLGYDIENLLKGN